MLDIIQTLQEKYPLLLYSKTWIFSPVENRLYMYNVKILQEIEDKI